MTRYSVIFLFYLFSFGLVIPIALPNSLKPLTEKEVKNVNHIAPLSSNSSMPTQLNNFLYENVSFSMLNTSYYYTISSSEYQLWSNIGVFLKPLNEIDVEIKLNLGNALGPLIGNSNVNLLGGDEVYVLQPHSLSTLNGNDLFITISTVNGYGNATFKYVKTDQFDIVPQTSNSWDTENLPVNDFYLQSLNYSKGSNIAINLENFNSGLSYVYDVYIFSTNGNLQDSILSFIDVDKNYFLDQYFTLYLNNTIENSIDGLILAILGKSFLDGHLVQVSTQVSLPMKENISPTIIYNLNDEFVIPLNGITSYYFAMEIGSEALGISVETQGMDLSVSMNLGELGQYKEVLLSKFNSMTFFNIQDYGHNSSDNAVGYSWYYLFVKPLNVDQLPSSIIIDLSVKTPQDIILDFNETVSSVSAGDTYVWFVSLSLFPQISIIWVKPTSELDVKVYFFKQKGYEFDATVSNNYQNGEIESVGEIQTGSQELYTIVIQAINGSGAFELNIRRSSDVSPPIINSITFNEQSINQGETFQISIDSSDNVEILNTTVYYRILNSLDTWKVLGYLIDSSTFILEYGQWEIKFRTFDVSYNFVESNNSGLYYPLHVLDNQPPILHSIEALFEVNTPTNVVIEISDQYSGISEVILQYSTLDISTNLTAVLISLNHYEVTIPAIGVNNTISLQIFAVDFEDNYFISSIYEYYVGDIVISLDVNFDNQTFINSQVNIVASIESNDGLKKIEFNYILPNSNVIQKIESLIDPGVTEIQFSLVSNVNGFVVFWIAVYTNNGGYFESQNYTIEIQNINQVTSISSTPISSNSNSSEIVLTPRSQNVDGTLILVTIVLFMSSGVLILFQNKDKILLKLDSIRKKS